MATTGQRLTDTFELWCLAGHFVGEGCIGWYASGPVVTVKSCVEEELFLYPRYFGGKVHRQEDPREGRRATFNWRAGGRRAIEFVRAMLPFLWADKASQGRIMLQAWEVGPGEERDGFLMELKSWKRVEG